jgi:hypothetical protein
MDVELRVRLLEVLRDGRVGDPQPARDLRIRQAFGDEPEHFALARRQACIVRNALAQRQREVARRLDCQDGAVPTLGMWNSRCRARKPLQELVRQARVPRAEAFAENRRACAVA